MSSLVVLTVQRIRKGSFVAEAPWSGRFWFAVTGISNGLSALTLFAAVRNGPITLVAPLVAIYPLVTVTPERDPAQARADHAAHRRGNRADGRRRRTGADRLTTTRRDDGIAPSATHHCRLRACASPPALPVWVRQPEQLPCTPPTAPSPTRIPRG